MQKKQGTIQITVHKDHLLTLGERMYGESIELVRELVNNAYDADATQVYITVSPESIVVEDNGSGMNEKGMTQFFEVGSVEKRIRSRSPRFGRQRIGQFGIGKFAALSAADQFVVESQKGKWVYRVVFDREMWQKTESWELPITKEPATPFSKQGTKVILTKLKKHFVPKDIKKYLHESVPLRAKKFAVYLNGIRISKKEVVGKKYPLNLKTPYGVIEGEIIIALNPDDLEAPGVVCRTKQVLVRREFFGLDKEFSQQFLRRLYGEVNADFLPVLAGRNDFVRDSQEYQIFSQVLSYFLREIFNKIKQETKEKHLKKLSRQLREVLDRVREALELNPDFVPRGRAVKRLKKERKKAKQQAKIPKAKTDAPPTAEASDLAKPKPATVLVSPELQRSIRLRNLGVSVALVSLGEGGPESAAEGNLIYINQDHPLYKQFYENKEAFTLQLARLITKEIILMKKLRLTANDAYDFQSKLLTDVFIERS